jgi:hypothetical protein
MEIKVGQVWRCINVVCGTYTLWPEYLGTKAIISEMKGTDGFQYVHCVMVTDHQMYYLMDHELGAMFELVSEE